MKSFTFRYCVPVLLVFAFACLPAATRADSFTLDGVAIDAFSINPTTDTLTVVMNTGDTLGYFQDAIRGTEIADIFLDEFTLVDGVTTLATEIDFRDVFVKNVQFSGSDMLSSVVSFVYVEERSTTGTGGTGGDGNGGGNGGGNNTVPEPSSAMLLTFGLAGLIGIGCKKLCS
jgi:hypothetical protein